MSYRCVLQVQSLGRSSDFPKVTQVNSGPRFKFQQSDSRLSTFKHYPYSPPFLLYSPFRTPNYTHTHSNVPVTLQLPHSFASGSHGHFYFILQSLSLFSKIRRGKSLLALVCVHPCVCVCVYVCIGKRGRIIDN